MHGCAACLSESKQCALCLARVCLVIYLHLLGEMQHFSGTIRIWVLHIRLWNVLWPRAND